jgi:hypothetical protein
MSFKTTKFVWPNNQNEDILKKCGCGEPTVIWKPQSGGNQGKCVRMCTRKYEEQTEECKKVYGVCGDQSDDFYSNMIEYRPKRPNYFEKPSRSRDASPSRSSNKEKTIKEIMFLLDGLKGATPGQIADLKILINKI